ncbi:peptidylprolyl isomerase [uncultured Sphingomonas sp.]|uniref:peptidylprolyl isomerase n=1 Tax=uncultured Sphingomonas sp. TaxID=158754 RepID=UPI0035CC59DC
MITVLLPLLLAQAAAAQSAGRTRADARSPSEIVAAAPPPDWLAVAAEDLLIMELAPGAGGRARRVAIQLMPAPFSQGWVANIRLLARARWWDGLSVNRVQDNYVVQWGDASEKKPLPAGLKVLGEDAYVARGLLAIPDPRGRPRINYNLGAAIMRNAMIAANGSVVVSEAFKEALANGKAEPSALPEPKIGDAYASVASFVYGWPIAGQTGKAGDGFWPVHCYAAVGVGRNLSPDTGTGAELYTVIGHAPRHLDRNIAVVGRVVEGIEHLSSLPRGTEALGFYKTAAERTAIRSIRLASDLPAAERPRFQYLSTESASFAAYADARANRRDAFFIQPAGGADICNVPVPVRRVP